MALVSRRGCQLDLWDLLDIKLLSSAFSHITTIVSIHFRQAAHFSAMHSSNYFVGALGLASRAFAMPSMEARRTVVSHVAKFDNTNGGVIGGVPVRGVTPLGGYEDLYYDDMGVIVSTSSSTTGTFL